MVAPSIVLASASPRRRELLARTSVDFTWIDPGPDGDSDSKHPRARVLDHGRFKALSGHRLRPDAIILASDTLVYFEGEFFPKPAGRADARRMLQFLEGKVHQVWTSVCAINPSGDRFEDAAWTSVRFSAIPAAELADYLAGDEWADKAGAYGIQGTAGAWAEVLDGGLDTVIGLPIELALEILVQAGACPTDLRR